LPQDFLNIPFTKAHLFCFENFGGLFFSQFTSGSDTSINYTFIGGAMIIIKRSKLNAIVSSLGKQVL